MYLSINPFPFGKKPNRITSVVFQNTVTIILLAEDYVFNFLGLREPDHIHWQLLSFVFCFTVMDPGLIQSYKVQKKILPLTLKLFDSPPLTEIQVVISSSIWDSKAHHVVTLCIPIALMMLFFQSKSIDIFSYFSTKTCCGYSLEAPHWGASNEYPQHMFLWRNKKNINLKPTLI